MANLKELLLQLKLSSKEVAVFLSLVKLGKTTAAAVARDSGITRTHIYDLVQGLIEKGLVSELEEKKIKVYEAAEYNGLLAFVSRQQKELQSAEKQLVQLASEFNALQVGAKQKTRVRFFDGVEGVKNIYEEIRRDFNKQTERFELLTIFSPENLERVMPGFQYFTFPNALGRDIVAADTLLPEYERQMRVAGHGVEYKIWPPDKGLFPTDNIAWNHKLSYIDLIGYPSGIIIENASIFQSFTLWFNRLWESLG